MVNSVKEKLKNAFTLGFLAGCFTVGFIGTLIYIIVLVLS